MKFLKNILFIFVSLAFFLLLIYACARPGMPQGGPDDLTPPHYVRSNPEPNAINFHRNKIEIIFDELVNVEKPGEKVIITPPQKMNPVIQAIGRKITVELKDTLLPNTTYTFDFTDAIVDNNEKNVLENFSFAFSTGEIVDTLMVGGLLLNAENLEPMPGVMIGLHNNMSDTAFTNVPFLRTTKTNELGQFWVRNVSPGSYHVFALNDLNRNFKFDQPGEDIAFIDSIFVPSFEPAVRFDTIWKDSIAVDTIKEIKYNRFTPDNIKLFLFKEDFERQFLSRPTRNEYSMVFNFNSAKHLNPTISLLNQGEGDDNWAIHEYDNGGKSITLWIKDSTIYKADSLMVEVTYLKSDSLNQLVHTTDTFNMTLKKKTEKKKDKKEAEKINFLEVSFSMQGTVDVFDTAKIVFEEPVPDIDLSKIIIEEKNDTLWNPVRIPVVRDSLNPRIFYINEKWTYEKEYRVTIDSASVYSLYGKWNNQFKSQFKFAKVSDYGHLYVAIRGNKFNGFGELLDNGDRVVRKSQIIDGELVFINLKPGKYYLRYIDDVNEDGKWTTGHYEGKLQPEPVYYYPGIFEIKQNFEFEQNDPPWDVCGTPVEKQKPLDITKNKPKEKKIKKPVNENTQTNNNTNRGNSIQSNRSRNSGVRTQEEPQLRR